MFSCTACSFNPFYHFFGGSSSSDTASELDDTPADAKDLGVKRWETHLHPRTYSLFNEPFKLLREIRNCIDARSDPILNKTECSIWQGKMHNHVPVINYDSVKHADVRKVLSALFADDESYESILQSEIYMQCSEEKCVCMHHIIAT